MNAMPKLIEEAIIDAFGDRCPETVEGCPCCDAWGEYDRLVSARQGAFDEIIEWHRKNARICREIAKDDPRIGDADRKRAGQAAVQHDASAVGIARLAGRR